MAGVPAQTTSQWSSRFAFIMAAVGSSVGLGNLWRFSAEAGENGGGAFILIYLACVLLIGIPVLMSEYIIGRAGNAASAIRSVQDVSERSNVSTNWSVLGMTGMVASFLIVSFYCVVAAWVVMYIPKFLFGGFEGLDAKAISEQFGATITYPTGVLPYFTGFALLTMWLVSRGVNNGIEMASKILMPLFFLLLIGLSLYSLYLGFSTPVTTPNGIETNGASQALSFLFKPDFGAINAEVATAALGQAFFSIGLGSAIMITYGSYLPKEISIPKSAIIVGLTDTSVALIAGLAIFPIVFANGLNVNSGAGLFFETLPVALSNAPLIGGAFFFLAIFAAVTSSISLLEPAVAWTIEKFNLSRPKAAFLVGGLMWAIGLISVFSLKFMNFIDGGLTGAIMLPLTGLLTVLFVGWRMQKDMVDEQMEGVGPLLRNALFMLVKYVAPIFVSIILVFGTIGRFKDTAIGHFISSYFYALCAIGALTLLYMIFYRLGSILNALKADDL